MNLFGPKSYEVVDVGCASVQQSQEVTNKVSKKYLSQQIKLIEKGDEDLSSLMPYLNCTTGDRDFDLRVFTYYHGNMGDNVRDIRRLGIHYLKGNSPIPKDPEKAIECIGKVMYQDKIAARVMGDCLLKGYGPLKVDRNLAKTYYGVAAKKGDKEAEKKLKKLRRKQTPSRRYRNPRYEAARTVSLPGFKKHK